MSLYRDILDSFHNRPGGFSARKLSAFYCLVIATIATFKFGSNNVSVELTLVWVLAAMYYLGIVTWKQIQEFRTGTTTTIEKKTESESIKETKVE
jgi:hypothetical protein